MTKPADPTLSATAARKSSGSPYVRRRSLNRLFLPLLALVSLFAILLRFMMSVQVVAADRFAYAPPSITDMATYHSLSRAILQGNFPAEFVYQPFYYAVFLPVVKILFRSEFMSVAIAQSICAGGIVWFAGLSAAMLRSRRAGLLAAVLCTFSTMLFFYVPYALIEIQQGLWFSLLLFLTLKAMRSGRLLVFALDGLVLSCAILSRGNAWCFLPAIALAFFHAVRRHRFPSRRRAAAAVLLFFAALILPQLPFAIRNSIHAHSISGPASAGPAVLTIGNNPESAPAGLVVPYPPTYDEWMTHLDERSIPGRMWDWFRAEPAAFLVHQLEKCVLFFDSHEFSNNIDLEYNAVNSNIFHTFGFIPTAPVIALALAGFLLAVRRLRRRPGEQILYLFLFLYAAASAAFYILARFRVPAFPFFAVAAALFTSDFCRLLLSGRRARRRLAFAFLPAIFFSACIVWFVFPVYRQNYESALMRCIRPHGVRLDSASMVQIHDNGPHYMDSWIAAKLDKDIHVSKSFSAKDIDPARFSRAFLTVTFFTEQSRVLDVVCNGRPFLVSLYPTHQNSFPFLPVRIGPVPVPPDLTFELSFPNLQPGLVGLAVDFHREYGRMYYKSEQYPAEPVIRLELER